MSKADTSSSVDVQAGRIRRVTPSSVRTAGPVHEALAEFRQLTRPVFLETYEYDPSETYFIQMPDGMLADSKPVLARAYYIQEGLPNGPMPEGFYGGTNVPHRLQRLEFTIVTPATLNPPRLGDSYQRRSDIRAVYGGDINAGIIRLPGDHIVNLFSDAEGPYADEPPSIVMPFGYRGEGLTGDQSLQSAGNKRLLESFERELPVRFWYKPAGESFRFLTWVVVIGYAWTTGEDRDGKQRKEIQWQLGAVNSPDRERWPAELVDAMGYSKQVGSNTAADPGAKIEATYSELVAQIGDRPPGPSSNERVRTEPVRSITSRRAVLLRANGKCESLRCTGMPPERNRQGEAILDVDHVQDLAMGGMDHPLNMVAICPNCHAAKTRGTNGHRWRTELRLAAKSAHERQMDFDLSV